jgi:hypothetical protein
LMAQPLLRNDGKMFGQPHGCIFGLKPADKIS